MAKLYYGKILPTSTAATSAAAGYPASNVLLESIARPWRATDLSNNNVDITWTVAQTVAAVIVEDANCATVSVYASTDGATFPTLVATVNINADKITGRRRALIPVNLANLKGIRFAFTGAATDGLAYWRIGAVYAFGSSVAWPRMASYGMKHKGVFPLISTQLTNGQIAIASTGPDYITLTFPIARTFAADAVEMVRRGRLGTVGIDLEISQLPEMTFPMYYADPQLEETYVSFDQAASNFEMRERV